MHLILSKARVSFLYVSYEVFNCFYVGFFLALTLFFVLFLHLTTHPTTSSLTGVPLLAPHKGFVGNEILPIIVEF